MKHMIAALLALCMLLTGMASARESAGEPSRTIRGRITQDASIVSAEEGAVPNPHAGDAAASITVRLVLSLDGETTEIGQTKTDADGLYEIPFSPAQVPAGGQLLLCIGEEAEGICPRELIVWQAYSFPFRSGCVSPAQPAVANSRATALQAKVLCSDRLFLDEGGEYRQELAALSLAVTTAAHSAPESDLYWNESGADIAPLRYANIHEAHQMMGFDSEYPARYYNYDVTLDDDSSKVAFSIAARDLINPQTDPAGDPEQKEHLVLVAVRSGGYGNEWLNNFEVGSKGVSSDKHAGFYVAAQEVAAAVTSYIRDSFTDRRPVRLWMTGYSRGAAVTGLAAEMLSEEAGLYDALYAYTFATPMGTKTGKPIKGLFNIVYSEDLIPLVAPENWGFGRNGTTLIFDGKSGKLSAQQAAAISAAYAELTHSDKVYNPLDYSANSEAYDSLLTEITKLVPDSDTYITALQPYLLPIAAYAFTEAHKPDGTIERLSVPLGNQYLEKKITPVIPEYDAYLGVLLDTLDPAEDSWEIPYDGLQRLMENELTRVAVEDYALMCDRSSLFFLFIASETRDTHRMLMDILTSARINMMELGLDHRKSLSNEMAELLGDILALILSPSDEQADPAADAGNELAAVMKCHAPEPYFAWLTTLSAAEMFGIEEAALSFDCTVVPCRSSGE